MSAHELSLQIDAATLEHLEAEAKEAGQSPEQFAQLLVEEGLRMATHPGIFFRTGPAGRRPVLFGGPDVWEVARLFQTKKPLSEKWLQWIASSMNLTIYQVQDALHYYLDFQDEIDAWIQRNDEAAERGYAEWLQQQDHNQQ